MSERKFASRVLGLGLYVSHGFGFESDDTIGPDYTVALIQNDLQPQGGLLAFAFNAAELTELIEKTRAHRIEDDVFAPALARIAPLDEVVADGIGSLLLDGYTKPENRGSFVEARQISMQEMTARFAGLGASPAPRAEGQTTVRSPGRRGGREPRS